jgi:hypothetical protein
MELALAVSGGDLSRRKGIERFVHLVVNTRVPFAVAPAVVEFVARVLSTDEIMSARFEALFRKLIHRGVHRK